MQRPYFIIILLFIALVSCRSARTPQEKLREILDDYPYLSEIPVQVDSTPIKISYPPEKFSVPLTVKDTVIQGKRLKFELHKEKDSLSVKAYVNDTTVYSKTKTKLVPVPENPKKNYRILICLVVPLLIILFVYSKKR